MITDTHGDLLDDDADALVNPVNIVGVMAEGVALAVKRRYPAMFREYERAARRDELDLGRVHVWATGEAAPRLVVNFPTQRHWRSRSHLPDIEAGLADLVRVIADHGITSLAVPALGCGRGGLDWTEVRPLIERALAAVPQVDVRLYGPGAPARAAADVGSEARRVPLTPARAALAALVDRYAAVAPEVTVMEVQKLLYFLQEAGHDLRLSYVRQDHGPDAEGLRHALVPLDGALVVLGGDEAEPVATAPIELLPGVAEEAATVIAGVPGLAARIERVLALARGYESPYGLELLATVHWVATREDPGAVDDPARAAARVGEGRPGRTFTEAHVAAASGHLATRGWFGPRPLVPASTPA